LEIGVIFGKLALMKIKKTALTPRRETSGKKERFVVKLINYSSGGGRWP